MPVRVDHNEAEDLALDEKALERIKTLATDLDMFATPANDPLKRTGSDQSIDKFGNQTRINLSPARDSSTSSEPDQEREVDTKTIKTDGVSDVAGGLTDDGCDCDWLNQPHEELQDAPESLYLISFSRYPIELRNALNDGPLLQPIRQALPHNGSCKRAKVFCAPDQFQAVAQCVQATDQDIRPYHVLLTASYREPLIRTVDQFSSKKGVRIKREVVLGHVPIPESVPHFDFATDPKLDDRAASKPKFETTGKQSPSLADIMPFPSKAEVKLGYGTATPDNASFSGDATPTTTVTNSPFFDKMPADTRTPDGTPVVSPLWQLDVVSGTPSDGTPVVAPLWQLDAPAPTPFSLGAPFVPPPGLALPEMSLPAAQSGPAPCPSTAAGIAERVMVMLSTAKKNAQGGAVLDSVVDDLEEMITKYKQTRETQDRLQALAAELEWIASAAPPQDVVSPGLPGTGPMESLYLISFSRYPVELRDALQNGPLLVPIQAALRNHGQGACKGAKVFCSVDQYSYVCQCVQRSGFDVRPYHVLLTASYREPLIQTIKKCPQRKGVRIKQELLLGHVPIPENASLWSPSGDGHRDSAPASSSWTLPGANASRLRNDWGPRPEEVAMAWY